jgi:hypothetical protein
MTTQLEVFMDHFGNCILCDQNKILKESHIIPKFVGNWLKKTSATGFFRKVVDTNIRHQDLIKDYLLCGDCEQIFGNFETEFSARIFYPYIEKKLTIFTYEDWLLNFSISIAFRCLYSLLNRNNIFDKTEINKAYNTWKNYLIGKSNDKGLYEHNLLLTDFINNTNFDFPDNIQSYLMRGIDADLISTDKEIFLYIKFPGFIFWINIYPHNSKVFEGIKILEKGTIKIPGIYYIDERFFKYLKNRLLIIKKASASMSNKQKSIITESFNKDLDKTSKSKTFEAMLRDDELMK